MKRKIVKIISLICLLLAILFILVGMLGIKTQEKEKSIQKETVEKAALPPEMPEDPLDRVIDWAYLKSLNKDIIAWLYIPGTAIDYPVCHSEGDYYLRKNIYRKYSISGSLFTNETMEDPHIAIFGHNMNSDWMFGRLQESGFKEAYIYTPDKAGKYLKVSDLICSKQHSVFQRGFSFGKQYKEWLERHGIEVDEKEQVISLAVCADGNRAKRYVANLICVQKNKT